MDEHKKYGIIKKPLDLEDSHPRQPRCAHFGEMLQMDASVHLWFDNSKTQLHIAVEKIYTTMEPSLAKGIF